MRDLTPPHLRCFAGSCPSVHELDDGRLQITGEVTVLNIMAQEATIIVNRELLANVGFERAAVWTPDPMAGSVTIAPEPYAPIDPAYTKPDVGNVT